MDKGYYIKKLWKLVGSLPKIIYFNFHYLPFKQAIRLPIWIHKADLVKMKGRVVIDAETIKPGMICMGYRECSIYPNKGVMWENHGGTVIFHGACKIGNDTYMSFGPRTTVEFGHDFRNSATMRLVSYEGITFGEKVSIGWDTLIMDTNIHLVYDRKKKKYKNACGKISIGARNWFGTGCRIMHSVTTPEGCIFGMNTIVTRDCEMKAYSLMGGSPVRILTEDVERDFDIDVEEYISQTRTKKQENA